MYQEDVSVPPLTIEVPSEYGARLAPIQATPEGLLGDALQQVRPELRPQKRQMDQVCTGLAF